MDGQLCRRFFLDPQLTFHRRYEALRAFFVDDRPVAEIAAQFGYKPTALNVMISRFHAQFRRGSVPLARRKFSAPFLSILGALLWTSLIRASLSEAHFQCRFVLCLVRREPVDWQGSVWFAC
jgi:hypothetical protein